MKVLICGLAIILFLTSSSCTASKCSPSTPAATSAPAKVGEIPDGFRSVVPPAGPASGIPSQLTDASAVPVGALCVYVNSLLFVERVSATGHPELEGLVLSGSLHNSSLSRISVTNLDLRAALAQIQLLGITAADDGLELKPSGVMATAGAPIAIVIAPGESREFQELIGAIPKRSQISGQLWNLASEYRYYFNSISLQQQGRLPIHAPEGAVLRTEHRRL